MNIKTLNLAGAFAASLCAAAATTTPQVTSVTMAQPGPDRRVFIDYTFTGADAVITLDVQTNAPGGAWFSIGGEAVCNAKGEVWKKVTNDGSTHRIEWRPDLSWPDHLIADGGARAVVTAWTLDNPPDYMVVDVSSAARPGTQRYYPAVDFLPGSAAGQTGAITNNAAYKNSMLVMRKIMAKDVIWTMGSTPNEPRRPSNNVEDTHQVTLSDNYYIGVFEVTQGQWKEVATNSTRKAYYTVDTYGRPMDAASWYEIRSLHLTASGGESDVSTIPSTGLYPNDPASDSFLGLLRLKTGIAFDLPSEAQWEFASRAGHGDGQYGDGTAILASNDTNLDAQACHRGNGRLPTASVTRTTPAADGGTAIVGSYRPNDWGLYDTIGNVYEFCLDSYTADIKDLNGAVSVIAERSAKVMRGRSWSTGINELRPAHRGYLNPQNGAMYSASSLYPGINGFRVVCPVEVE